jgi:flagellar biogenesis protein FliO
MPPVRFTTCLAVLVAMIPLDVALGLAAEREPGDSVPATTASTPQTAELAAENISGTRLRPRAASQDSREVATQPLRTRTSVKIVSSLAIVVGGFLLLTRLLRGAAKPLPGLLPYQVVEVLGKTRLAPRQDLHLVRLGHRLLLMNLDKGQVQTVCEITDTVEVQEILTVLSTVAGGGDYRVERCFDGTRPAARRT